MNDLKKTKKQLIAELEALRRRTAGLEAGDVRAVPQDDNFRLLIEKAVVGIYIIQDGKIVYVNTSFARTFGYDPEEIIGNMGPTDLIHPDNVPKTVKNLKKRMEGKLEKGMIAYKAVKKDGSLIWIELYSVQSEFQGRPAVMGTLIDITERKRAEDALHESEQKFRSITETATDYIFIKDRLRRYTFINKALEDFLGLSEKEILGKTAQDIFGPEQGDIIKEVDDRTFSGETVNETRSLTIGGKEFFLNAIQTPLIMEGGEVYSIMGIIRDITKHIQVEHELLREKFFTDIALDAQLDTFFLFEPANGKALRWNEAFKKASGYSDKEIASMPAPASYYSPADLERAAIFIEKVFKEGVGTIELELICKDGSRIPTEYRVSVVNDQLGKPKYIISIGRDITERRQAEKALRESEQKFRTIADQSLMGISILQDNRIKYINQRMSDLLEYSVEEYMSFNFIDFAKRSIHPDDFSFAMEQAQKKQSGEPDVVTQYEYRLITKSGKVKWVEQYSKTIEYLGKPADFITLVDISNRKKAEEETKQYRHKLRELANQHILMEEQQKRKISNVLHDNLGQYLTAAQLFLAPMIKEQADDEEKEKLNQIYQLIGKANDDAHSIIEEISPSALYEQEFGSAIEWLTTRYIEKYDMSISLHCDVQDVQLEFEKKVTIFKAVQELLLNVLKHAETKEARVTIQRKDNFLITEVSDDGAGFSVSQEDSRQIARKGMGLFNISERIGSLGGELSIDSEPGRGTRIIIKLPEDT